MKSSSTSCCLQASSSLTRILGIRLEYPPSNACLLAHKTYGNHTAQCPLPTLTALLILSLSGRTCTPCVAACTPVAACQHTRRSLNSYRNWTPVLWLPICTVQYAAYHSQNHRLALATEDPSTHMLSPWKSCLSIVTKVTLNSTNLSACRALPSTSLVKRV
jgi:hypothetical protein